MVKTRLCNRFIDGTLAKLMRIAMEGPEQNSISFEEVLLRKKNHRVQL